MSHTLKYLMKTNSRIPSSAPSHLSAKLSRSSRLHQYLRMTRSSLILNTFGIILSLTFCIDRVEARWPSTQLIALQATERIGQDSSIKAQQKTTINSDTLQILVISELMGYIEPCGCTIDLTLGAIERLSAQIKKLKSQAPTIILTAGSHLFEHEHVKVHSRAQEEAKARLIRQIFAEVGIDAHIPGPLDLAAGVAFYRDLQKQYPLAEVTLNHAELSPQGQSRLIELNGLKVGVFGIITSPIPHSSEETHTSKGSTLNHHSASATTSEKPLTKAHIDQLKKTTAEATQALKAQGAQVVIGLAVAPRLIVRKLAEQSPQVDLWVLGEKAQEESALSPIIFNASVPDQRAYLVEAGDRGRHLASLKLSQVSNQGDFADPQGDHARALKKLRLKLQMKEKFASRMPNPMMSRQITQLQSQIAHHERTLPKVSGKRVEYRLIPITANLPADDRIHTQVKAYQDSLQQLNQAARKVKPPPANGNGYAGQAECSLCHPDAQSFWEKTKHAQAWETLVKTQKTFDVECVSCHVTGWQEPGGSALGHTDKLQDVQCESCHGPATKHAEIGGGESYVKLKVPAQKCETCHNQKHSPKFNYERYLKKVIGPGHGAPMPE